MDRAHLAHLTHSLRLSRSWALFGEPYGLYSISCNPYVKWVKFYPHFTNEEAGAEADF